MPLQAVPTSTAEGLPEQVVRIVRIVRGVRVIQYTFESLRGLCAISRTERFANGSNGSHDQCSVNDTVTDMITWMGTPFSSVGVNRH